MGLLTRFRKDEAEIPPAWLAEPSDPPSLVLQRLGEEGFSLRDPQTNASLLTDDDHLEQMGAIVVEVVDIATRRDARRCQVSRPGQDLTLAPEGRRVAVLDRAGSLDIGYVDDPHAPKVRAALDRGVELRAMALWETLALDGTRTDLHALIVPQYVELILSLESPAFVPRDEEH